MSLCLIARDKNDLWIGADTAVSIEADGKSFRVANACCEKVFRVGDDVVFCSGLLSVSSQIKSSIAEAGTADLPHMYNYYNGQLMPIFKLSYWAGIGPEVNFDSPCSAYANWNFPHTTFSGSLDFSGATVFGLEATFA